MANTALLAKVPIPAAQVARIRGEADDAEAAAAEYARAMTDVFGSRRGELPSFDLILLGMGVDGHTASLFPGSPALADAGRLAAAVKVPVQPPDRVTMTPLALRSTKQILFLVTGAEKAGALARVFGDGQDLPTTQVAALAPSRFLVDDAAAEKLP